MDHKDMRRFLLSCIWITLLLTFCTWMVWTAGLSSLQYTTCTGFSMVPGQPAVGGCSHIYQLWWWVWAFEFAVILALSSVLAADNLRSTRVLFTGLLATLTVLTMFGSNTFFYAHFGTIGSHYTRVTVTDAGFIMTAAMNLLLLIFVGINPQPKDHDSHVRTSGFIKNWTQTTTEDPTTSTPSTTIEEGDDMV